MAVNREGQFGGSRKRPPSQPVEPQRQTSARPGVTEPGIIPSMFGGAVSGFMGNDQTPEEWANARERKRLGLRPRRQPRSNKTWMQKLWQRMYG